MNIAGYMLEVLICSGVFLVAYRYLLAGKVAFRLCRAYIVATMLLSAVIPALDIPVYSQSSAAAQIVPLREALVPLPGEAAIEVASAGGPAPAVPASGHGASVFLFLLYASVSAASLAFVFTGIVKILRIRLKAKLTRLGTLTLAESVQVRTPFSFLRTVYIGPACAPSERSMIIAHESSHVRHLHSVEKLAMSLLRSLLWFNPFIWMAERDLSEVQEWEADRDVLDGGTDLALYRNTIFKQLFGYNPDISCGLNHSLTKKRFVMMTQKQTGRHAALRLASTIPLLAAALLAFGCGTRTEAAVASGNIQDRTDADTLVLELVPDADAPCVIADGNRLSLDELEDHVRSRVEQGRASLVSINAPGSCPMGLITDLKQILREAGALRVQLGVVDGRPSAEQRLPPSIRKSADRTVIPVTEVTRKWLHEVKLRSDGSVLLDGDKVAVDALSGRVANVIVGDLDAAGPGTAPGTIFSIQCDASAPYEAYVAVQKALNNAYGVVRDGYSEEHFGLPMDELDDDRRQQVIDAVPKRISEAEPAA